MFYLFNVVRQVRQQYCHMLTIVILFLIYGHYTNYSSERRFTSIMNENKEAVGGGTYIIIFRMGPRIYKSAE